MNTITKEGVIYTRVSSLKQVTDGNGLDSQKSACLNFAKKKNINIINSFKDGAISGNTFERPGLHQIYLTL